MPKFKSKFDVEAVQLLPLEASVPPRASYDRFSDQPKWLVAALKHERNPITIGTHVSLDYINRWGKYLRDNRMVYPTDWVINDGHRIYVLSDEEFSHAFEAAA